MSLCGVSVQLGSTPPSLGVGVGTPASRSNRRSANAAVSFYEAGSFKSSLSRSLTPDNLVSSLTASRSFGAQRTTTSDNGASAVAGTPPSVRSASRGSAAPSSSAAARPLHPTTSIPKSAQFVKIEGFDTSVGSPAGSGPPSPQQPRVFPSLLSRQLSTDRLPSLAPQGSLSLAGLGGGFGSTLATPQASMALEDSALGGLAARLEQAVRVAPVPRPAPLMRPRPSVPDNLLQQLQQAHPVFREPVCVRAFGVAKAAHDGRHRVSGEPALLHCVEVARILAELGADEQTVSAALLHDALDATALVEGQLAAMLGDDAVVELVKQVAHLGDVSSKYRACPATSLNGQTELAGQLVGMLVAMGCNTALLVKLADRLHDMRTLGALPAAKRNRLARETVDVWAPLANRLGVWSLKAKLEDLAFKQLYPGQYAELRARLEQLQSADVLVRMMDAMKAELQRQDIRYHDLSGRPKHLWGVWRKMAAKGYGLARVSDVRGLRIIVESKADCYRALRAVETVWRPVGPTKDYIRRPKENGYRSLHTVVRGEDGHDIEVQIRTAKMHFFAEYGAEAAHWQYKERGYSSTAASGAPAADAGAVARSPGGAAREANWAKFVLSQQVRDQKFRPSGSPSQDQSLASIVGAAAALASDPSAASTATLSSGSASSGEDSPGASPPRDARFAAYLERSGQQLQPPEPERVVVAVVHNGGLVVEELAAGATLGALCTTRGLSMARTHALVNKQLEGGAGLALRTGDIVDLYEQEAPSVQVLPAGAPPAQQQPAQQPLPQRVAARVPVVLSPDGLPPKAPLGGGRSNVLPLGALRSRLRSAAADAAS